ncbi:SdpI family protein [Arthrobacter sp. HMSC08H08]|uniref:SdpI family protein n=1 Tax=Arthrobacter sp. HMSC08H08 TaxID=1581143 RepID=UPI0008A17E93|nr:SdpI family protein [Arthrobacter sp. HMSC08H08]OFT24013.1 hypothetical protein HMPREF3175_02700 [Arthrobacter sp. HMSC08H08]
MVVLYGVFLFDALLVSLMAMWVVKSIGKGSLERNPMIGIRTRATLASDEAWAEAHKASLPHMNAVVRIGNAGALLSLVSLLIRPGGSSLTFLHCVVAIAACALQVIILVWGAVVGHRRAKEVVKQEN